MNKSITKTIDNKNNIAEDAKEIKEDNNNKILNQIFRGDFWKPFLSLSITQLLMLLASINIIPLALKAFNVEASHLPIFLGLAAPSLLFGTGASIFAGSKIKEFLSLKQNIYKVYLMVILGTSLMTLLLGFIVIGSKDILNLESVSLESFIIVLSIIVMQNIFLSFNILLRVTGNIMQGVLIQGLNLGLFIMFLSNPALILLSHIALAIVILWAVKVPLKAASDSNIKENEIFTYRLILKEILIFGIPTFMVQFVALFGSSMFLSTIPASEANKGLYESIYNIYFSNLSFVNLFMFSIINGAGIILTLTYFSKDKKTNLFAKKALENSVIATVIFGIFASLYFMIFKEHVVTTGISEAYNSPNYISMAALHITSLFATYTLFASSLLIGGLYQSVKKPAISFVLSILKLYIIFMPITIYSFIIESSFLKLYSGILSDIITIIIVIVYYFKLKKEVE